MPSHGPTNSGAFARGTTSGRIVRELGPLAHTGKTLRSESATLDIYSYATTCHAGRPLHAGLRNHLLPNGLQHATRHPFFTPPTRGNAVSEGYVNRHGFPIAREGLHNLWTPLVAGQHDDCPRDQNQACDHGHRMGKEAVVGPRGGLKCDDLGAANRVILLPEADRSCRSARAC
jgi:hypothetical protein